MPPTGRIVDRPAPGDTRQRPPGRVRAVGRRSWRRLAATASVGASTDRGQGTRRWSSSTSRASTSRTARCRSRAASRPRRQARRVLDAFRARKLPVVHVRHVPKSVTIVDGEPVDAQYRIRPEVAPTAGEKVVTKQYANSFRETDLLDHLRAHGDQAPGDRRHADAHVRRGGQPRGRRPGLRGGGAARRLRHAAAEVRRHDGAGRDGARRRRSPRSRAATGRC